jgi:hypothetical protein
MRDNRNAFFWSGVEPFQEFHSAFATSFVGLTLVTIPVILIVDNFRKVKVREFFVNFGDGSPSIANIVPISFSALFTHKKPRSRDVDPGCVLWRPHGSLSRTKKCWSSWLPWFSKDMQGSLACSSQR